MQRRREPRRGSEARRRRAGDHADRLDAFKVGENIATTPGKVVFRNRLFELIQYTPTTETGARDPLLIFPPWINKFYIMDLQPKNSHDPLAGRPGHTVFVVSWVNPDARTRRARLRRLHGRRHVRRRRSGAEGRPTSNA